MFKSMTQVTVLITNYSRDSNPSLLLRSFFFGVYSPFLLLKCPFFECFKNWFQDLFKKSVVLCGEYTCTAQNSEINLISSFICYFLFPIQVLTLVIFTEIVVSRQNMHAQAFVSVSRVEWGEGGECQEFCEIKISLNFSGFRGWNLFCSWLSK